MFDFERPNIEVAEISEDKKFAAVQLFQFVPYTYQPVTAVHYFTNDAAAAVAAFLTKSQLN